MTEEQLMASEQRFRSICESAPVLINGFDENGCCTLWNEQCRKTFGWTFDEINAQDDALALFYPDPDIRNEVLQTITTDRDEQFRESHPQTKDGRTLTTVWENIDLPNGQSYSVGHDITAQRKAQDELKQYQGQLEERIDERTHELRAIVNAMAGRENRMAELKEIIDALKAQLSQAGVEPQDERDAP